MDLLASCTDVLNLVSRPWPKVENVGQKALGSDDACVAKHSVQLPSGRAYEWNALALLVLAPCLAYYGNFIGH